MSHYIAGELLATFRLIKALCNVLYSSKLGRYLSRQYLFSSICNTAFNLHIHICMYVPVRTYVPHIIFMANPLTSHYVCLFESYSKTYLGKYYLVTLVDWKILNIRIIVESSTIGHNRKSWQERPEGLCPKTWVQEAEAVLNFSRGRILPVLDDINQINSAVREPGLIFLPGWVILYL